MVHIVSYFSLYYAAIIRYSIEKTRSKQKISAHSPVKSPHSRHYTEEEVEPEGQASDDREWNSRFSVRDGRKGGKKESLGVKNETHR